MGRKRLYNTEEEVKEAKRLARKRYVDGNREKVRTQVNNWHFNNREYLQKKRDNYVLTDEQKEKKKIYKRKWYVDNKKSVLNYNNNYITNRKKDDPLFKLKCNLRTSISKSIRTNGYTKKSKTYEILGCSFEEFKNYIESKWEPWMDWSNHGKYNREENYGWDLDHITPISSAINEANVIELNHYSNFQPLCSYINRDVKRDKLSMDF